jgi:hypothetical protein
MTLEQAKEIIEKAQTLKGAARPPQAKIVEAIKFLGGQALRPI